MTAFAGSSAGRGRGRGCSSCLALPERSLALPDPAVSHAPPNNRSFKYLHLYLPVQLECHSAPLTVVFILSPYNVPSPCSPARALFPPVSHRLDKVHFLHDRLFRQHPPAIYNPTSSLCSSPGTRPQPIEAQATPRDRNVYRKRNGGGGGGD